MMRAADVDRKKTIRSGQRRFRLARTRRAVLAALAPEHRPMVLQRLLTAVTRVLSRSDSQ
jgi:hypothetical protein